MWVEVLDLDERGFPVRVRDLEWGQRSGRPQGQIYTRARLAWSLLVHDGMTA